ncbi:MAG TPA: phosphotransferase family protein [Candidatus Binataceae bacterium]|nr:phosphotransferase family protein [Candidatus Binataceae bacterium]
MAEQIDLTAEYGAVRDEEQLDWSALAGYLRGRLPGADAPMRVMQFRGGSSNLTYLLDFGESQWVVRRPPFGPLPVGGHDMGREFRVLSRLWQAFAAAPRAMLLCEDAGIIGAPFFVMERRHGIVFKNRQPIPAELGDDPETFRKISEGFIDTLADLHGVDYEAIGLGGLGKPAGFFKRQIAGWMKRWEAAKTREVPLMEKLGAWFLDHMPVPQAPALLHNDFYLHNVMLDPHSPGRVAGVFDWEMSTLGDPMIDLGVALGYWRDPTDTELLAIAEIEPHTLKRGFLRREDLARRYASRTGRDLTHLPFYQAWAHWKSATVGEQIYVRYVRRQTTDPRFALMGKGGPALAAAAARILRPLGFIG